MKEYVLIFRMDITTLSAQPTAEQMEGYMQQWMSWLNEISASGQLASGGNHLSSTSAKVLRSGDTVSSGPYVSNSESVAGYIIIRANDLEGAEAIARKCPILQGNGTSVEVREAATPDDVKH